MFGVYACGFWDLNVILWESPSHNPPLSAWGVWKGVIHFLSPLRSGGLHGIAWIRGHPWPNVSLYAFPPIKLIPAVLCRVKVSGACLLLIAPFWPSQTWFSELNPLLYRPPWEIPIRRDLLSQLQGKIWHPQPELWKLWVWPIQGQGLWLMVCLPKFRKP